MNRLVNSTTGANEQFGIIYSNTTGDANKQFGTNYSKTQLRSLTQSWTVHNIQVLDRTVSANKFSEITGLL